jgi:hypothetical protein
VPFNHIYKLAKSTLALIATLKIAYEGGGMGISICFQRPDSKFTYGQQQIRIGPKKI